MPELVNLLRRVKAAIAGGMLMVVLNAGLVAAAQWPLKLPVETFVDIPDSAGMAFFYGTWHPAGAHAQGGPMKIRKGIIESGEPVYFRERYRVIHEARNYVLVVHQYDPPDVEYPTTFAIYSLQGYGWPTPSRAELRRHRCGYGTWGVKEAFEWPTERLLETFKRSMCLRRIEFDGSVSIGWGNGRFVRE